MVVLNKEAMTIVKEVDVIPFRNRLKEYGVKIGMSPVNQTKLMTAASELARNMLDYGGGGIVTMEKLDDGIKRGLRLTFEDHGPGIPDIQQALKDGFTSGTGLGLGLGGARRLCNEFSIESTSGVGTKVTIARWK